MSVFPMVLHAERIELATSIATGSRSILADRLKSARSALGASIREVVGQLPRNLGISPATLGALERGEAHPSPTVLSALSGVYERPINWFLSSETGLEKLRYWGVRDLTEVAELQRIESTVQRLARAYLAIEEYMRTPLPNGEAARHEMAIDPKGLAAEVRERAGIGHDAAVPSMVELLEQHGTRVMEFEWASAIEGLAADWQGVPVFVLNAHLPRDRARLAVAEQLAWVLAGKPVGSEADPDLKSQTSTFASHLLVSSPMLREAFREPSLVRLIQLRDRFGVPLAELVHRAETETIIEPDIARRLWVEFSKRGWTRREPGIVRDDRAIRFETLLDQAILVRGDTLDRLAKVTGLTEQELADRLRLAAGRFKDEPRDTDPTEVDRQFRLRIAR